MHLRVCIARSACNAPSAFFCEQLQEEGVEKVTLEVSTRRRVHQRRRRVTVRIDLRRRIGARATHEQQRMRVENLVVEPTLTQPTTSVHD